MNRHHVRSDPNREVLKLLFTEASGQLVFCFLDNFTNIIVGSNDQGEYLGTPKEKKSYIGHNKGLAIDVYPINVHKHESQYATFAILAAKGNGRDPLCIVDFGLGLPDVST